MLAKAGPYPPNPSDSHARRGPQSTLAREGGASLRAVGAKLTGPLESHERGNPARPRKSQQVYHEAKYRWEL